jgi:hypothetical protein
MNCGCPICKNMRKSKKRGGGEDIDIDVEDGDDDEYAEIVETGDSSASVGGRKRKGRKTKRRTSRKGRKGRKTKRRSSRRR